MNKRNTGFSMVTPVCVPTPRDAWMREGQPLARMAI